MSVKENEPESCPIEVNSETEKEIDNDFILQVFSHGAMALMDKRTKEILKRHNDKKK
jgi:hypothetical protein